MRESFAISLSNMCNVLLLMVKVSSRQKTHGWIQIDVNSRDLCCFPVGLVDPVGVCERIGTPCLVHL